VIPRWACDDQLTQQVSKL